MRYFIEVAYLGTHYSGFQIQKNGITIQGLLEDKLKLLYREPVELTGSSRTDAGVHSRHNFFHFDIDKSLDIARVYNLNAMLPKDIVVLNLLPVADDGHSRFDAIAREYRYHIHQHKNPFLNDRSYYYPYPLDVELLNVAASHLLGRHDFTSFSKRNTQVNNFFCTIEIAEWYREGEELIFHVRGNRFLRGMVRGLVATMLRVGRNNISLKGFLEIIEALDCSRADFAAPAQGLFLENVIYPEGYFKN